mgnify:CR=1 FL=1
MYGARKARNYSILRKEKVLRSYAREWKKPTPLHLHARKTILIPKKDCAHYAICVASISRQKISFCLFQKSKEMSARSLAKTLLLSRTIADIAESKQVKQEHVAEAFTLRFGGGSQW